MKHYTFKQFFEEIDNILTTVPMPYGLYLVNEQTEVNYGDARDLDLEYCEKHNIPAYWANRAGGTIVCSKGNIGIAVVFSVEKGWQCMNLLNTLNTYLINKGLNSTIDENDILIDGYKVASTCERRVENHLDRIYLTAQISINQDIEAIKNICKKPMIKVPKGLGEYSVTTEEMLKVVQDWFSETIKSNTTEL